MRVCVVGAGGREHALADVLARTAEVVVTPGNAGIPGSVATAVDDVAADLVVIGPEVPLVDGLADRLRAAGRLVLGPGADGARLEGSKDWMKGLLAEAGVPTARYRTFSADDLAAAIDYLGGLAPPFVVKTDGLAAGKGVLVTADRAEAADDVAAKLAGTAFGAAGRRVVIEEGLRGPEVSLLCLVDGRTAVALPSAQDFKRVGDGDTGPNTGGMGAYSPVAGIDGEVADDLVASLVQPTLDALRRRGIDYRGVLYAGLMMTADGPKVLEYNVRFGDPEAQVVLPRLGGDVAALLAEAARGDLRSAPEVQPGAAVTVVAAAGGYPLAPRTGDVIHGAQDACAVPGVRVYWAGVAAGPGGRLLTAGGRVAAVTGLGRSLAEARQRAYEAVGKLSWPGLTLRNDIGLAACAGPSLDRAVDQVGRST